MEKLSKTQYKVLNKLIVESFSAVSSDDENQAIDYLVAQGYVKAVHRSEKQPNSVISKMVFDHYEITEQGMIVRELRRTEERRFLIPTTISIVAIVISIVAIIVSIATI